MGASESTRPSSPIRLGRFLLAATLPVVRELLGIAARMPRTCVLLRLPNSLRLLRDACLPDRLPALVPCCIRLEIFRRAVRPVAARVPDGGAKPALGGVRL